MEARGSKTNPQQQLMFIHLPLFACAVDRILTGLYSVGFYLSTFCIMRQLRCILRQLANHRRGITKCFCRCGSNDLEGSAEAAASVLVSHLLSSFY